MRRADQIEPGLELDAVLPALHKSSSELATMHKVAVASLDVYGNLKHEMVRKEEIEYVLLQQRWDRSDVLPPPVSDRRGRAWITGSIIGASTTCVMPARGVTSCRATPHHFSNRPKERDIQRMNGNPNALISRKSM